jgi:thiamine-monophosphate kinase
LHPVEQEPGVIDPKARLDEVGERAILRYLRERIPGGAGVTIGVGDDAAAVEALGPHTLVTVDCLVEGTHFRREWAPPRLLGRKALSASLSDVAAMGGTPRHATISLCLPPETSFGFLDGLYDGLLERAAETSVNLIGGNVAAAGSGIVVDVTLLGQAERLLRRSGAEPGDRIMITGALGAPAAGLLLLAQGVRLDAEGGLASTGVWTESSRGPLLRCLLAQLDPRPPIALGRGLGENDIAHAAIDVSDGLSGDLLQLCEASGLRAWIDAQALPVDPDAAVVARAAGREVRDLALNGGEEYQLLLAVPPDRVLAARELGLVWNIDLTEIGQFEAGEPAVSLRRGADQVPLEAVAYDHFLAGPRGRAAGSAR